MPNLGIAQLSVEKKDGRSVVTHQFGQAPLQVHCPLYLEGADFPVVYLRTPSSGLLDGDIHELDVFVQPHAQLELRTQAATLVYPGRSELKIRINVAEDASFSYLPHQLILAAGSSLRQTVQINLADRAKLIYKESWCAGRIAMNERWRFSSFENKISIVSKDKIVFREHYDLCPDKMPVSHPLLCDKYTHFSTFYAFGGTECNVEVEAENSVSWTLAKDIGKITRVASFY